MRKEIIGDATLYLGDCMDVLPTLGKVDAVITDPPYGMAWDGKVTRGINGTGKTGKTRHYGKTILNDEKPFDPSFLLGYPISIIWGMNHYPHHLKKGSCLVWIKRYDTGFGSFLSDAEVAFFSKGHGVYCFRDLSNQSESSHRAHPTQKPVPLMRWCIERAGNPKTILDPFAGSGTTGVAAIQMGRKFIGIERDAAYFDIACRRIEQAAKQGQLFAPEPQKQVQESLIGGEAV